MIEKLKKISYVVGLVFVIWNSIFVFVIFLIAFSRQSKTYYMAIDNLGEANLEMITMVVSIPFIAYFVYKASKDLFLK